MSSDGSYPVDPDLAVERLNRITFLKLDAIDAYWHSLVDIDPKEMLTFRLDQKVYLARYAHISPEYWTDKPIHELNAYYEATGRLVQKENGPKRG